MVVGGNGVPAGSVRFPASRRILMNYENPYRNNKDYDVSDQFAVNFSDTVFGFLEQDHGSSFESNSTSSTSSTNEDDEEDEVENGAGAELNKAFWDQQNQLLKETLCKISSLELKIRNATKDAIKEAQSEGNFCLCRNPVADGTCRNCLMREVASRLRNAGYDSAVSKSKWRSSPDMPSGEHTFVDVIDNSKPKKQVRIIIELNLRPEFEISRASDDYKKLISRLPEAFVGKSERVKTLIKILCTAAKKCIKDNKMHMGPWRKQKYMQAKWFSKNCERMLDLKAPLFPTFNLDRVWESSNTQQERKMAMTSSSSSNNSKAGSMLTVALLDAVRRPNLCSSNAVAVVV